MKQHRTFLAAIALSSLSIAVPSDAANSPKRSVTVSEQHASRPANLYKIISQSDRSICGPIVTSLNRPLNLPNDDNHRNLAGDLLLGSDLQVPWRRKLVGWSGNLDYADVDIANDGHVAAVFRLGRLVNEVRSEDDLYVLSNSTDLWHALPLVSASDEENSKASESISELAKQSTIDLYSVDQEPYRGIWHLLASQHTSLAGDHFNVNVLSVEGRSVLILAGANESAAGLHGRPFHVFAFLYRGHAAPSLVCGFRAGT